MYKKIIVESIKRLLGNESVFSTSLPSTADFIVNHQPGHQRIIVNCLHYIPERRSLKVETIEEKIPLFSQDVSIDLDLLRKRLDLSKKVSFSVIDENNKQEILYKLEGSKLHFTIDKIDGFRIISINYQ